MKASKLFFPSPDRRSQAAAPPPRWHRETPETQRHHHFFLGTKLCRLKTKQLLHSKLGFSSRFIVVDFPPAPSTRAGGATAKRPRPHTPRARKQKKGGGRGKREGRKGARLNTPPQPTPSKIAPPPTREGPLENYGWSASSFCVFAVVAGGVGPGVCHETGKRAAREGGRAGARDAAPRTQHPPHRATPHHTEPPVPARQAGQKNWVILLKIARSLSLRCSV